jgi:hypothetical protein
VNICALRENKFIYVFCEKYRMRKVCVFEMEYGLYVRPASGCTSSADWLTLYWTKQNTPVKA